MTARSGAPADHAGKTPMNEAAWDRLIALIKDGFVVPVAGCRLMVDGQGQSSLQARVARRLLERYGLDADTPPLPPFRELNEAATRLLALGGGDIKLQDLYVDAHAVLLRETAAVADDAIPAPIRQLAEIADFRLFVTLTPDDLLARRLRRRCAVNEIVHAPRLPTSEGKDLPRDWMERQGEVQLLYLFGKSRPAPMFAIHDEDILEYAHNVIARGSQVPGGFLGELQQRNILLIGCNFPEWLARFFLRATRQNRLSEQHERREWLIEQLQPDESLTCFLRSYSKTIQVLSDIPPVEFVAELHRRWMDAHGGESRPEVPEGQAVPRGTLFFISYSRKTDLPRAEALYQALLKLGASEAEVWFDRHSIEPGSDFSHRILDGIQGCRYFLALLSKAANDREEAFVFREWQEANLRKQLMNRDFLFPVIVDPDYEPERYQARPILDGDWKRLDYSHAPEGVPDPRMTGKLRDLLRQARRGE